MQKECGLRKPPGSPWHWMFREVVDLESYWVGQVAASSVTTALSQLGCCVTLCVRGPGPLSLARRRPSDLS